MQNFISLGQPLLGEKYVAEKKEKKNNHKNSGHFVPLQRLRAVHALRSIIKHRIGRVLVNEKMLPGELTWRVNAFHKIFIYDLNSVLDQFRIYFQIQLFICSRINYTFSFRFVADSVSTFQISASADGGPCSLVCARETLHRH